MRLVIELKPEADQNLISQDIHMFIPKVIRFIYSKSNILDSLNISKRDILKHINFNLKIYPKPRVYNETLIVGENYKLLLTLSSYSKRIVEEFNGGILKINSLLIQNRRFKIKNIELLKDLDIETPLKVRPMSPILSGSKKNNQKYPFYYRWNHPEFLPVLETKIKNDYKFFYKKEIDGNIKIKFDQNYLKYHKDISQLVLVNKRRQRAIWAPLYLSGSEELIQFALDMGIGLNREQGYGMIEISTKNSKKKETPKKKTKPDLTKLPDNFGNLDSYYEGKEGF